MQLRGMSKQFMATPVRWRHLRERVFHMLIFALIGDITIVAGAVQ